MTAPPATIPVKPAAASVLGRPRAGRMLIVTAGWGACFVAIRYGLKDAPVLWFSALRALLAGAALLVVGRILRRPSPPRPAWPGIVLLGLVNVTVGFSAMFAGTEGLTSGVAAVLANAQPLLIVLPAWALYSERPQPRALAGLVIGFAGLIVTVTPGGVGNGALLSLAAAAAITTGTLLARRLTGVDVVTLAGWQFVVGGVVLAGWALAVEGAPAVSWTPRFIASLTFLALFGSAATYLIWFVELHRAPLVTLSAWTMLTPVFGIAFGWLIVGDRLSTQQAIGTGLVLTALPVILLPSRRRRYAADRRGPPSRGPVASEPPQGSDGRGNDPHPNRRRQRQPHQRRQPPGAPVPTRDSKQPSQRRPGARLPNTKAPDNDQPLAATDRGPHQPASPGLARLPRKAAAHEHSHAPRHASA